MGAYHAGDERAPILLRSILKGALIAGMRTSMSQYLMALLEVMATCIFAVNRGVCLGFHFPKCLCHDHHGNNVNPTMDVPTEF